MNESRSTLSTVYVIVLAWNHIDDTRECLASFCKSTWEDMQLVVIDNGSTDGTAQIIHEEFPQVVLLRSETNLGIAGGYNLGIDYAFRQGAPFILIANNDITVDPMMVPALMDFLEHTPKAGIAMPKIYHYYGNRSRLWTVGARWRKFPPTVKMIALDQIDHGQFSSPKSIDFAPSCCYLIRRAVVEKIGGYDIGYFFYFDDWDYSARVRNAGFSIWLVPTANMWHKVSISTQKADKPFKWWKIMGQSAYRFYTRHYSGFHLICFTFWYMIREIIKLKPVRSVGFAVGVWQNWQCKKKLREKRDIDIIDAYDPRN